MNAKSFQFLIFLPCNVICCSASSLATVTITFILRLPSNWGTQQEWVVSVLPSSQTARKTDFCRHAALTPVKSHCICVRCVFWQRKPNSVKIAVVCIRQSGLAHISTHECTNLLLCIQSNRGSCRSEWTIFSSTSSLGHLSGRNAEHLSCDWRVDIVCACRR